MNIFFLFWRAKKNNRAGKKMIFARFFLTAHFSICEAGQLISPHQQKIGYVSDRLQYCSTVTVMSDDNPLPGSYP